MKAIWLVLDQTAPSGIVRVAKLIGQGQNDEVCLWCRIVGFDWHEVGRKLGRGDLIGFRIEPEDVLDIGLSYHSQVGIVVVVAMVC